MRYITEPERRTPVVEEADVVVAGGGPAGLIAAVASARQGARTVLIERYGFLGGMATTARVGPFASTRHRYSGLRIVGGLPWELIERLVEHGGATLDTFDYSRVDSSVDAEMLETSDASSRLYRADTAQASRGDIPLDPEVVKRVADGMALEAGVRLRYHTTVAGVMRDGGELTALVLESKSGRQAVTARVFVDATGDADLAARAGAPFELGRPEDGALQPLSMMFRLGGVDTDALGDISRPFVSPAMRKLAVRLAEKGELPVFGGPWTFWGSTFRRGEVMVNMVRLWGDATNTVTLTRLEIIARDHIRRFVAFLRDNFAEFGSCYLLDSGPQIGIRETRRIVGDYVLTVEDIKNRRTFPDSVALGGHVIDIHSPDGKPSQVRTRVGPYQIPYRCLIPRGADNLLVAGRPISATHEAHGSLRVMGTAMATGQAAGVAAALAARMSGEPGAPKATGGSGTAAALAAGGDEGPGGHAHVRAVDPERLRSILTAAGALIDDGVSQ